MPYSKIEDQRRWAKRYYKRYRRQFIKQASEYRQTNRQYWLEYYRRYSKERIQRLKREVIEKYGNKCNCCGEKEITFLSIDHKKNNGQKERVHLYSKLSKLKTKRRDLQVLCMNCQFGRMRGKICPHKRSNYATR